MMSPSNHKKAFRLLLGALLFACERSALPTEATQPKQEALTWEWLNPLPQGERISAGWIKSGKEAYFASPSYLLHTKDSGETWETRTLRRRANFTQLWGEGDELYVRAPELLMASGDGGLTWQERPATSSAASYAPPKKQEGQPGDYYEAKDGSALYIVEGHQIYLSTDGGATRKELSKGASYPASALSKGAPALYQVAPGELYAVNEAAIMRGEMAGKTWVKSAGEALTTRFSEERCAASTQHLFCYDKLDQRLLQFEQGRQIEARETPMPLEGLAALGAQLIARGADGLLSNSRDQGATWQALTIDGQRPVVQRMWSLSPTSLYLKVEKELWYTQDSGASWKKCPFLFLPEVALFEGQGTLFVIASGEVYFLSGTTWDIWRDSLQKARFKEERAEGIFFMGSGEIFVATTLTPSKKPSSNRLLLSTDDGLTWREHTLARVGEAFFNYHEQRVWVSPSREVFLFGADLKIVRGTFSPMP